jgi:hypothetical protein
MQCPQNCGKVYLRVECCGVGKAAQCGIWKGNMGVGKAAAQKLGRQGTDAWSQEANGEWDRGDET